MEGGELEGISPWQRSMSLVGSQQLCGTKLPSETKAKMLILFYTVNVVLFLVNERSIYIKQ